MNNFNNKTQEWWIQKQQKDSTLQELQEDKSFVVKDGILYKTAIKSRNLQQNQVCKVVPSHLVNEIIEFYHNSQFAGHSGSNKTKSRLLQAGYWFPDMDGSITTITKRCSICQQVKGNKSGHTQLTNTSSDLPFKRVAIDHFGPLPQSENGSVHILVVIDMFSRFVELYPVKSLVPMELANSFYGQFILRHGVPEQVMLDNARTFSSEFNQELARLCGIELQFTPAYHAASNGMIEKFMKTLRSMILLYTEQAQIVSQWDKHLRVLRFVYNNTYHSSIKAIPFELVHGRTARTPLNPNVESNLPSLYRGNKTPQRYFGDQLLENLQLAFDSVLEARKLYSKEDIQVYQSGDKVMMFNFQLSTSRKPRKLSYDWLGPLRVTEVLSETRLNLKYCDSQKDVSNVHTSHLKPFYE